MALTVTFGILALLGFWFISRDLVRTQEALYRLEFRVEELEDRAGISNEPLDPVRHADADFSGGRPSRVSFGKRSNGK